MQYQRKYHKGTPYYPRKIYKSLPACSIKGNTTKERHIIPGKYINLYQHTVSNFARLLGVCPSDYYPERANIPRKKANF